MASFQVKRLKLKRQLFSTIEGLVDVGRKLHII